MSGGVCKCAAIGLAVVAFGCKGTLRGGLSEHDANQIALALDAAQIGATKVAGQGSGAARYEIQVPAADMAPALRVLEREQLPRPEAPGLEQLFDRGGLIATPAEERARWTAATAGELSRSLERIAGVADARVHLALDDSPRELDEPEPAPKASVLIRLRRGVHGVDPGAVRALVAGAVDGLEPARVTVVQAPSAPAQAVGRTLVQIGPIHVTRSSALALKAVLGSALVLDLVLAVTLVVLWRNRRRTPQDDPGQA
jgi:type III secretion protein J